MATNNDVIQVTMLGTFAMQYRGSTLRLERTNTTKAMQALQLLLYRSPEGVPRDTLLDTLYGQEDAADPANNLKVTISNLRKLLSRAGLPAGVSVLYKNGCYHFVSETPVCLDAKEFAQQAALAQNAQDPEQRVQAACRAIALYEGEFLPHLMGVDWAVIAAAGLRRQLVDCMRIAAEALSARGQWESLLEMATKVAKLYGGEEWHCLRIDCLMKLERWGEAKQVYDQAVADLAEKFDVKPSEAMADRLRQISLATQENTQTVGELVGELAEHDHKRGPFYCSYPSFIDVYRMCARMLERTGQTAFLAMYWLVDSKGRLLEDPEKIAKAAGKLGAAIGNSLRRGDAFTQHGRDRFLVLLIGTSRENCAVVNKRITENYKKDAAWGVGLRSNVHLVEQKNDDLESTGWTAIPSHKQML